MQAGAAGFLQPDCVRLGGVTGDTIRDQTCDQDVSTRSYAAYADLHLPIGDTLHLNVGGRFTDDEKTVQVDFENRLFPPADFRSESFQESWSEFTPRLALTWRPRPTLSLFASYTQGFTSGGFNTEEDTPEIIGRPFDPETLTAVELGVKTASRDNRVSFNATLFRQEYEDKQEGFLLPGSFFSIFNASEATMEGAELELAWTVSDYLSARATYSYLDAEYDRFVIPGGADFSGNKLQTAPETSYSVALDYRRNLGANTLSAGLSYTWQDDYFTGASNVPEFLIDDYALVNARIAYAWNNDRWTVKLWGKNLADEDFVRIRGTSGAIAEYYGPPRTYGVNLTYASE